MTPAAMPPVVEVAIARASDVTGLDLGFLLGEARRESAFDPSARAPTSSAAGLFQFVDQTWLATVKRHGSAYGYARYAGLIEQTRDGRFEARDPQARAALMSLRLDPRAAALMAAAMAADHARWLKARMGRAPSAGELYAAHFMGREGAARLIEMAQSTPGAPAAPLFPQAAKANPSLFYRQGRAVGLGELYGELTGAAPRLARTASEGVFDHYAAARRAAGQLDHRSLIAAVAKAAAPAPSSTRRIASESKPLVPVQAGI